MALASSVPHPEGLATGGTEVSAQVGGVAHVTGHRDETQSHLLAAV